MLGRRSSAKRDQGTPRARHRSVGIIVAVIAAAFGPFMGGIVPAFAGVATTPVPSIPNTTNTVQVGQTNLPSDVTLINNNTPPNQADVNSFTTFTVTPGCGSVPASNPPCSAPDPGIYTLNGPGTGRVGTACAGRTFNITPVGDPAGSYLFTVQGAAVTLTGLGTFCTVDFTSNVVKAPTIDVDPAPGLQTRVNAAVPFTSTGAGGTITNFGTQQVTVLQANATLSTQASTNSTSVPPGTSVTDVATVAGPPGSPVPTGTVTYTLVGPNPNAGCTAPVVGSNTQPVGTPSAPFTPTAPGTYNFVATYSGDVNYAAITVPVGCGVPAEIFAVAQLPIALATAASTNSTTVPPGTTVTDLATLTPPPGGPAPTGTVTYTLVGPNPNAGCTAPVVGSNIQPVGTPSAPFTPTAPGTYNFVATYSGDVNYAAITTPVGCGVPAEMFAIALQPLTLVTQASTNSATVAPGTAVSDLATLTPVTPGGPAPTGTVTYILVGPNPNAGCTAPIVGSTTVAAGQPSGPFTVTAPGLYNFVATYSGDGFYAPISTAVGCGVPAEQFTVAQLPLGLTTQASTNSPAVAPGSVVTDLAIFTPPPGGPVPTGTVTYTLVGPNPNAACTAPVVGAPSTVAIGSPSAGYTVVAPGTYNFVATYSGDANYAAITTPVGCGVANEMFTVALQPLTLATQASTNSAAVAPGTAVTDLATLTPAPGAPAPTGTVTYTLVGPNPNAACTAPLVGAPSTVPAGSPSAPFTVTAPGLYNFVATYSGDGFYAPISTPVGCGVPAEQFTVAQSTLTLVTQASTNSATVAPGTVVTDTAILTPPVGGPPPTGTVTYTLVGPNPNAACTAPVVGASSTVPAGQPSGPFTVTALGTYNFVATYSGDANYAPISTPVGCGVPAEQFAVASQPLTLVTQASTNSPTVPPGTTVTDLATLTPPAGGPPPTGTVTYTLVGPNPDPTCTTPVVGSSTVPAGTASGPFTPTAVGAYNFVATYSGDPFYAPITTPVGCGVPAERFSVALRPLGLTTQASVNGAVVPGTTVTDTAVFTPPPGGPTPTGTVTYTLVGPNPDPTCAAPIVGSPSTTPVGTPSAPYTVTAVGVYNFVATYSGDANYAPVTTPAGCGDPNERFTVTLANVALTTLASPPVPVGGNINDVATLSGGVNPTGTITFDLFGPDNVTCTGPPVFTSVVPVNGNGNYISGAFPVPSAGSFRWVARYSGDAVNAPAGPTACADPLETTAGLRVTPQLRTEASAGVVGGQVFDTAFLTGGFNPTGTITFQLFGPNDPTCARPPIFTSVRPVTGNGAITSESFLLTATGVYSFVARYSGDANNNPIGPTACNDPAEQVGAGQANTVRLTTVASPTVTAGNIIFDTATLANGFNPTGTITFNLFGPDNPTCAGTPIFVSQRPVNGNGVYVSTSFNAALPGTYRWIAVYSGDANNIGVTTACNDPLEQVVVTPLPTIMVDKTVVPDVLPVPGGTFLFTVVVTNTSNVALTITSLTDDIYFNITAIPGSTCNTAIGIVLAPSPGPGNTYTCRFPGDFRRPTPATQTDVVTVTATDNRGNRVTDNDDAVVRLTPVPPTITTVKTATPPSLPEPGGTFTFNFQVTNTGPEAVTITSLVDDVYGNLNGRGTCAIGARLAPNGGTYSCSFTGSFFGNAGAAQTDTITTTARDDNGQTVVSRANATVRITDVPPTIRITKTPSPVSRPEPGGTFRFTVVVTNTSFEPLRITSLVDDIYGNLNGRGTCAIGAILAANGGTYTCAFDGDFIGRAGASQTDTVTVIAVDDDNTSVTAVARATVTLTPLGTPPVVLPPPPPPPAPRPPLVRTGSDATSPARLAFLLVAVGMLMVLGARRFGDGGPGLAPLPAGPGGGGPGPFSGGSSPRGGPGGPDGGRRRPLGGASWFGSAPSEPPSGPVGSVGLAPVAAPAPSRVRPPVVDEQAWADDLARAEAATMRATMMPPLVLSPDPEPTDGVQVEAVPEVEVAEAVPEVAETEVLVPTVVVTRVSPALDAVALDAAADLRPAHRPATDTTRRGRRFGGR